KAFPASCAGDQKGVKAMMAAKFFEIIQLKLVALLKKEERHALERVRREELTKEREHNETDDTELAILTLLIRKAFRQHRHLLRAGSHDTLSGLRRDLTSATQEELDRQEIGKNIQGRAIVLSDGRRVYFTRDGRQLYGENYQEILDASRIEEARNRLAEI